MEYGVYAILYNALPEVYRNYENAKHLDITDLSIWWQVFQVPRFYNQFWTVVFESSAF